MARFADTIIIATILIIALCFVIIANLLMYYFKRKRHLKNELHLKSQFQQTLLQSQLEIQEQTLKNISQEIHDNIGQMLSLAKLNLGTTEIPENETARQKVENAHRLVSKSIADLRNLSRSLNTDYVSEQGLQASIAFELELIGKSGQHKTALAVEGEPVKTDAQKELILFRMVQECFNNTIKHAQASQIDVGLKYEPGRLAVSILDNGQGFSPAKTANGLGLRNLHNRAKLIGAEFSINSENGKGTLVLIQLPI